MHQSDSLEQSVHLDTRVTIPHNDPAHTTTTKECAISDKCKIFFLHPVPPEAIALHLGVELRKYFCVERAREQGWVCYGMAKTAAQSF